MHGHILKGLNQHFFMRESFALTNHGTRVDMFDTHMAIFVGWFLLVFLLILCEGYFRNPFRKTDAPGISEEDSQ